MVEDFLWDPVMAAEILMGFKLDVFQKLRLRKTWFAERVIDSSGFSSAKTANMWLVSNLRCLLLSDRVAGCYYQQFTTGQNTYWTYYAGALRNSPFMRAHMGSSYSRGWQNRGPSCWKAFYKNGSEVWMPAPGFLQDAKTQAGYRFSDLYVDEFTKIESTGSDGINAQLIGRTTKATYNQHHPLWGNHMLFTATAEDSAHPAWRRYSGFLEEVEEGNPNYQVFSYSFKDYSDLPFNSGSSFREKFRNEKVLKDMKKNKSPAGYRQEALGIWSVTGKTLYSGDLFDSAWKTGEDLKIKLLDNREEDDRLTYEERQTRVFHFGSGDPAKADNSKNDDGALVSMRAESKTEELSKELSNWWLSFVWGKKVRGADTKQWSGMIHRKHQAFNFGHFVMDGGGGGLWVRPELRKEEQVILNIPQKTVPIACIEDEQNMPGSADYILSMWKCKDKRIAEWAEGMDMRHESKLIDIAHTEFKEAWAKGCFAQPKPRWKVTPDEDRVMSEEKAESQKCVDRIVAQLKNLACKTAEDGSTFYNRYNAREFICTKGRKDFAMAGLMCFFGFLTWLHRMEDGYEVKEEDGDMFA